MAISGTSYRYHGTVLMVPRVRAGNAAQFLDASSRLGENGPSRQDTPYGAGRSRRRRRGPQGIATALLGLEERVLKDHPLRTIGAVTDRPPAGLPQASRRISRYSRHPDRSRGVPTVRRTPERNTPLTRNN